MEGGVGLGNVRLAILDLSPSGNQPMSDPDGRAAITYNGEVYNFAELRADLPHQEPAFRGTSDTEVILRSYLRFGAASLPRMNGMFAFALWDRARREVVLARDHLGIKPLYYYWNGAQLVFGSEIKALLASGLVPRELDFGGFNDYLTYNYVPGPRTMLRGVSKLMPGHRLTLDIERIRVDVEPYWRLPTGPAKPMDLEDCSHLLRARLGAAVRRQMVSDVPLGAFLSGGIDSSLIVGFMAEATTRSIDTFCVRFDEPELDESRHAALVAHHFGTRHHEVVLKPDATTLERLAVQFDEPFADPTMVANYALSDFTRQHVTVALAGDGGDELFAGYGRFAAGLRDTRGTDYGRGLLAALSPMLRPLPVTTPGKGWLTRRLLRHGFRRYIDRVSRFQNAPGFMHAKRSLLLPAVLAQLPLDESDAYLERLYQEAGADGLADALGRLLHVDCRSYLLENGLTKVDRTSMLVSLEVRVPFLDLDVVDLAFRIPSAYKLGPDGVTKPILRKIAAEMLPVGQAARPKQGFDVPMARWLRCELADYARDVLLDGRTVSRGILRREYLELALGLHQSGRRALTYAILIPLMFELWCRQYLDH